MTLYITKKLIKKMIIKKYLNSFYKDLIAQHIISIRSWFKNLSDY